MLARTGGAERTLIDFIGEVKDEYGTTIQNLRDKVAPAVQGKIVPRQRAMGLRETFGGWDVRLA